jgi:hypothetical protein
MKTPRQAVDAFVSSERILQDMNVALDRLDRFNENVVLRKWTATSIEMEFRGFVHKGRLTALSQYNHVFKASSVNLSSDLIN